MAARTAQDVHLHGVSVKFMEDPITAGGLPLNRFSLDPTSPSGNVRARHVVFFAGRPETRHISRRDDLLARFPNTSTNTTIAIGGNPGDAGWNAPGSYLALKSALQAIRTTIDTSGIPMDKTQFILFVSDHGQQIDADGNTVTVSGSSLVAGNNTATITAFPTFTRKQADPQIMRQDLGNQPGFSFFVDFFASGQVISATSQPFAPGAWNQTLHRATGGDVVLNTFITYFTDLDGNGVIGNQPGEGVTIFFPMDEETFIAQFLDTTLDITVRNNTAIAWTLKRVSQTLGDIGEVLDIKLTAPRQEGNSFRFEFTTDVGLLYRVDFKTDLPAASWTPLQGNILGGGTPFPFVDTTGISSGRRFHRVVAFK